MKKLLMTAIATTVLCGGAFAQQGQGSSTSLNVNPNTNVMPYTQATGNQVNPSTLNGAWIGSGNANGNTFQAANGNSFANGNMAGNGSLNGTSAANGLSNSALNGTRTMVGGNRLPILNGTRFTTR